MTRSIVFSREEYARRLAATRAKMRERDAEIVLVDEAEHLAYLTGFDRSATRYQACAIPLEGEPVMFLRALDEPSFLERSWLTDRVTIADWEDSVAVIARELRRRGWANRRIGLELDSNYLTVRRWQSLTAALPAASFVDFGEVLRELRLRKSSGHAKKSIRCVLSSQYGHRASPADLRAVQTAAQALLANQADDQIGRLAAQPAFGVAVVRLIHQLTHLFESGAGSRQLHKETDTLILLHCVAGARSYSIRHLGSYLSKWIGMRFAELQILSA